MACFQTSPDGYAVGTVAGGCFWGTELHLQRVDGVIATAVGYPYPYPYPYPSPYPSPSHSP